MRIMERYSDYYREFLYYTPFSDSDVRDWKPGVRNELIVYLHDGNILSYNCVGHSCSYVDIVDLDDYTMSDEEAKNLFAYNLTRIMEKRFFKQKDLADKTGISQMSISKYINGVSMPSIIHAKRLATALDCTLNELVYFD